jgi:hypothetical protein
MTFPGDYPAQSIHLLKDRTTLLYRISSAFALNRPLGDRAYQRTAVQEDFSPKSGQARSLLAMFCTTQVRPCRLAAGRHRSSALPWTAASATAPDEHIRKGERTQLVTNVDVTTRPSGKQLLLVAARIFRSRNSPRQGIRGSWHYRCEREFRSNRSGKMRPIVGDAGVSIEVFADLDTPAERMVAEGRDMFSWIPNTYIKFPCTHEGLRAAQKRWRKRSKAPRQGFENRRSSSCAVSSSCGGCSALQCAHSSLALF